MARLN